MYVEDCDFSYLPPLPPNLDTLFCSDNVLSTLPSLPASLVNLVCGNDPGHAGQNYFDSLPALGPNLQYLYANRNPYLKFVPSLPDHLVWLDLSNDDSLICLPPLTHIQNFFLNPTNITCVPNYGNVSYCDVPLTQYPLCDPISGCRSNWNISGAVYYNDSNDCIHHNSEPFLLPVKMNLYHGGNLLQQGIFPGVYSFSTGLGNYTVEVDTADLPFVICPGDTLVSVTSGDSLLNSISFEASCKPGFDIGACEIHT